MWLSGADGAVLVGPDGSVLRQPGIAVPGGKVVDTTGAGDCFRAAFAVAMVEGAGWACGVDMPCVDPARISIRFAITSNSASRAL